MTHWQPLPDGNTQLNQHIEARVKGARLTLCGIPWLHIATLDMADDIRLCRATEDEPVTVPVPDWSYSGPAFVRTSGGGRMEIFMHGPFPQGRPNDHEWDATITLTKRKAADDGN